MAYLTAAQVEARLSTAVTLELTTDTGSTVDSTIITDIIAEVEGLVNTYLRQRTAATITEAAYPQTFAALKGATMSIVGYQLHLRRPKVPDDWKEAAKQAMEWLKALAAGDVPLPDVALAAGGDWGSQDQNAALIHDDW